MSQEDLNLLLANTLDEERRLQLTDHILDCEDCTARFRACRELHQTMNAPQRKAIPFRYVVGVAAVLFMASSPYFRMAPETGNVPETATFANVEEAGAMAPTGEARGINLLDRVEAVNFNQAVQQWGTQNSLTDLVALQNRG